MALTKAEVNERYYSTVGGKIAFGTEAQGVLHVFAVAKLIAARARELGRTELKILELGANDCSFATGLLKLLTTLTLYGEADFDKVDYFAVEFARLSLEAFLEAHATTGDFQQIVHGAERSPLVGSLTRLGDLEATLHLVHSEGGAFVRGGAGGYDLVIVNELLDDLPCRAFYSDTAGTRYELFAHAHEEGKRWRVVVDAEQTDERADLPPSSLTVTSSESTAVVAGAARLLASGGIMLVHDYGFVERYPPLSEYEGMPPSVPEFVDLEFPPGSEQGFPRAFFRIFGDEEERVVQITTDVGFAELIDELAPRGRVITLPHGNALLATRESPEDQRKGDGVFLSEFGVLEPDDDLEELLGRLDAEQAELRRRYADEFLEGRSSVFSDLLFDKR